MKNGLLIDMDGVIYGGDIMIPSADAFIAKLVKEKIPFTFMTNNSQRTPLETVRKLKKLGIAVTEDHVYTSAMATAKFQSMTRLLACDTKSYDLRQDKAVWLRQ